MPGEIFVRMAKQGSTISGLMDSFATAISLALQHGVPLKLLVDKFSHTRFEPSGFTGNQEIPIATSIMDYLFRWLSLRFPTDGSVVELRQVFEAEDFGDEFTPELREQEERLRAEIEQRQQA